jgi:hypothetical protein
MLAHSCRVLFLRRYSKDRISSRERLLIGLMLSNAVYSTANMIPLNYLHDDDDDNCGDFVMTFTEGRWARGWWFLGKCVTTFRIRVGGLVLSALLSKDMWVFDGIFLEWYLICIKPLFSAHIFSFHAR